MVSGIPTRTLAEAAVTLAQGTGANTLAPEVRSLVLLGGIVDVVVIGVLAVLVVQHRRPAASGAHPAQADAHWRRMLAAGLVLPLLLISIVLIVSAHTVTALGDSDDDHGPNRVDRSAVIGLP
jgi:heme/copper-type cytochrome/quinol oxidase subunit 2